MSRSLTRRECAELVRSYPVNAGDIDFAVRNAGQSGVKENVKPFLEQLLGQHLKLMHDGDLRPSPKITRHYTLQGLNIRGTLSPHDDR